MTTLDLTWTPINSLPSGHRLFRLDAPPSDLADAIAIADCSGRWPHTTDDGVLWVDTSRPISIFTERGRDHVHLPLLTEAGARCATPIDRATVTVLTQRYGMRVEDTSWSTAQRN